MIQLRRSRVINLKTIYVHFPTGKSAGIALAQAKMCYAQQVKVQVQRCSFIIWCQIWRFICFCNLATPWSLNLLIRLPFQLHGQHTVLQPFWRIELMVHIAIPVLLYNHLQVKSVREKHIIPLKTSWSGLWTLTAGTCTCKAPRCNRSAASLSIMPSGQVYLMTQPCKAAWCKVCSAQPSHRTVPGSRVRHYIYTEDVINPCSAELLWLFFSSFEAGIANAIYSFKWRKILLFMKNRHV